MEGGGRSSGMARWHVLWLFFIMEE